MLHNNSEACKISSPEHCCRAFVVGLSDEAGAGANVGLAAKMRHAPTALEVARVDDYVQETLWGIKRNLPYKVSLQDHANGGICASLFWVPTPVSHALHASCIMSWWRLCQTLKGFPQFQNC